jgi:hypothetical protein
MTNYFLVGDVRLVRTLIKNKGSVNYVSEEHVMFSFLLLQKSWLKM